MGDSITDGWKLDQYFPGKPYINRGISGQTTPQMLVRFRPDAIALQPKVVVILAGTNDLEIDRLDTGNLRGELAQLVFGGYENGSIQSRVLAKSNFRDRVDGKCKLHRKASDDSARSPNLIPEAPSCQFA